VQLRQLLRGETIPAMAHSRPAWLVAAALAAALVSLTLLGAVAIGAKDGKLHDKDSARGASAVVQVDGTIIGKPGTFTVRLASKPSRQPSRIGGVITCNRDGRGPIPETAAFAKGGQAPLKLRVKPTLKRATACQVQANGELEGDGSGKLKLKLFHKPR